MKVRTDYTGCHYLTAGKVYKVDFLNSILPQIIDDFGEVKTLYLTSCAHIDNRPWEIVDETPEPDIAAELAEALTMVRDYVVTMKGIGHDYQLTIDAALAKYKSIKQ